MATTMATTIPRSNGDALEFRFTTEDFAAVRTLIYQHAGINLGSNKIHMVYSRLARRLRARGLTSFEQYLALIEHDAHEWESFTNSLTTNLTHFFREPHHFEILRDHVLSLRTDTRVRATRPLNIWCAAASTGEEAYSIAMTLMETFDSLTPPVRIFATDLDTQVLAKAARGVYTLERAEKVDPARRKRFFLKGHGAQAGFARVRPELQALISFRQLNLLDAHWPVQGPFDAIFCRNVMIYFDKPTQYRVLARLAPLLRPDGLLFAGHSESFHHAANLFRMRGKTVYALAQNVNSLSLQLPGKRYERE